MDRPKSNPAETAPDQARDVSSEDVDRALSELRQRVAEHRAGDRDHTEPNGEDGSEDTPG